MLCSKIRERILNTIAILAILFMVHPACGQEPRVNDKVHVIELEGTAGTFVEGEGSVMIPFGTVLEIADTGPNQFEVWYESKAVYVFNEDVALADSALDLANQQIEETNSLEFHGLKVHALYSLRRFPDAIIAADIALSIDPNHIKTLQYKASSLFWNKDVAEAEKLVEKLLKLAPNDYMTHANHFFVLQANQEMDLAVEAMERAVKHNSHKAPLLTNLAYAHWAVGNLDRAAECCRKAIEVCPVDSAGYQMLGLLLLQQDKPEAARKYLEKAAERKDPHFQTYNVLADLSKSDQKGTSYLKWIKQAAVCSDCEPSVAARIAFEAATSVQRERRDPDFSLELANQLLEAHSTNVEIRASALKAKAAGLGQLNKFNEAMDALELINPDARDHHFGPMKEAFLEGKPYKISDETFEFDL